MNYNDRIEKAVEIILENILTPILFMYEDEIIEFIVFSDSRAIRDDVFRRTEAEIYFNLGLNVEITDIREFANSDRTDIMTNAELLFSESDEMLSAFEAALFEDMEMQALDKIRAINRKNETGTYYVN